MRPCSIALRAFLDGQRRSKDASLLMADCFTFTLQSGTVLSYTNADLPITWNGETFLASSVLVDGLTFTCRLGLDVDQQKVTVAARPSDTVGGVPFLVALAQGVFDGCGVRRERVFLLDWDSPPVGGVTLFRGRVATIDQIGRTSAEITVASDLSLLNVAMPRNFYQLTCVHTLYDSGCGLTKAAFGTSGTVETGSTLSIIRWSGAAAAQTQGTLLFTTGGNAGVQTTIKSIEIDALHLAYPLRSMPRAGDAFIVYQGCDHRLSTCRTRFNNGANFRGFPFVPPPTTAY